MTYVIMPDSYEHLAAHFERIRQENATARESVLAVTTAQRDLLRAALVKLVGASERAKLEQLEAVMRLMPAPAEDKAAATIDAIHALIATEPA